VRVRYFICNTPPAYAVVSALHRPVESATLTGSTAGKASGHEADI